MNMDFIGTELKKWFRDPLMRFMAFYPILFGIIGRFFLPWLADNSNYNLNLYTDLIIVVLTLTTPYIYGALVGFSLLDDRDDHILTSIKVTPLGIHAFLALRLITVFMFSLLACVFVMWFSNIGNLSLKNIWSLSFLASLTAPATGLLINALSRNKIEGFAVMKGMGSILIFPIIALFFMDKKELFFAIAPGFWPAKAISTLIRGEGVLLLTYNQYYFIGLAYAILLNILVYQLFLKRVRI